VTIIGHQEVTLDIGHQSKQGFMIEYRMGIESFSGAIAAGCVRGVNKKHMVRTGGEPIDYLKSITLNEGDSFPKTNNVSNPLEKSLWIPT
jgi:hypothetical protein